MASIPSLWDIGLWLGVSSAIMLIISEVLSPCYGRINLRIEFKKLRRMAIALALAFLFVISLNILSLVN